MKAIRELAVSSSRIAELIDSGQFSFAEKVLGGVRAETPILKVLRAQMEIYFSRLAEAETLLDEVAQEVKDVEFAARYSMARGELCYWLYEYEAAEEKFQSAYHFYKFLGDTFAQAMALYNLGRLKRRCAKFDDAETLLERASEAIKDHRDARANFLQGLIHFNHGLCKWQRGQLQRAEALYQEAAEVLRGTENSRYYGMTLNCLGNLYTDLGRYSEAIGAFKTAIDIFEKRGSFHDLEHTSNNLAVVLIRLSRFDEAEPLLQEGLELAGRVGDIADSSALLASFAELHLLRGDLGKAHQYAARALDCADLAKNEFERARALTTLGRVSLTRGDHWRSEKLLSRALEIGEKLQSRSIEAPACLYLAECALETSPVKAQELFRRVQSLLDRYPNAWLQTEFQRIVDKAASGRITVTEGNKLVIDGTFLPSWKEAKEAVEVFLIKNALRQTGNNLTKAGALLGVTKVHVHNKKKQYHI